MPWTAVGRTQKIDIQEVGVSLKDFFRRKAYRSLGFRPIVRHEDVRLREEPF